MATPTTSATAPEQALIPTFTATIGGIEQICADARFLHAYLQNGDRFAGWINDRLQKYGFEQGTDYELIAWEKTPANFASENTEANFASEKTEAKNQGRGGHNKKDYRISLDMAKELSMVENNARGREARRYFIAMERKALGLAQTVAPVSAPPQPQPVPPTAREKLNATDTRHMQRAVHSASNQFRLSEVANQGIWVYLRKVTDNPAPNAYTVEHIPMLAAELRRVLAISYQVRQITHHIEAQAIKRIFRKGEVAEKVLAYLAAEAASSVQELQDQMKDFPAWMEGELLCFTERKPDGYGYTNLRYEQPDFFVSAL